MAWAEFGRTVTGKRIAMVFSSPACDVEAMVIRVEPDGLTVQTTKTSDGANCPKGTRNVPRKDVRAIRMIGARRARVGLALLGAVGGYAATVAGSFAKGDEFSVGGGHVVLFTAGAVGGAVGGYYLGKRLSSDVNIIVQ